jgi:PKD repeat protein
MLATCLAVTGCSKKPTADFSADVTSGAAPLTVQFTDHSTQGGSKITAWQWDFGDSAKSTEQSPSHVYATAGTYGVSLEVTTSSGSDTAQKPNYITVTGGSIPYAQSQAMYDALTAQVMGQVVNTPLNSVITNAATFLASQGLVTVSGTAETGAGVWAQLKDGSFYVLMIDPKTEIDEESKACTVETERGQSAPSAAATPKDDDSGGVPSRPLVFLNLVPGNPSAVDLVKTIAGYASNHGYSNATGVTAAEGSANYGTVDWFKTLADYGVAYVNSKGFTFSLYKDNKAPWVTAVMTTDPRDLNRETDPNFMVEKISGHVFDGTVVSWKKGSDGAVYPVNTERYFVSSRFFLAYCGAFETNSMLYLDGGAFRSTDMTSVFTGKNVGMFMGWNAIPAQDAVDTAARYLFSRAFGEQVMDPPVPPNRPASLDEAFSGLELKHFDTSTLPYTDLEPLTSPIELRYGSPNPEPEVMLRPSIWGGMWMASDGKRLVIPGNFGDTPGTVTVGGTDEAVDEWNPGDSVWVEIGSSDIGDVVVTLKGHESNTVPLCQWSGSITADGDLGDTGPHAHVQCAARIRSDVHKARSGPPDTDPIPVPAPATFEQDCTGSVKFDGTFVVNKTKYVWSGGGALDFHSDASQQTIGEVIFNIYTGSAVISLATGLYDVNVTMTDLDTGETTTETTTVAAVFNVTVPMTSDGSITPEQVLDPTTNMTATIPAMTPNPPFNGDTIPG